MRRSLLLICLALTACGAVPREQIITRAATPQGAIPPVKAFAAPRPEAPIRGNAEIARDFLDLSFQLESGRELPVLTRFEEPVTVRVLGQPPAGLVPDLARLLGRLRREAGIDIRHTGGPTANITIQSIPRAEIRRQLPQAACFVIPNVSSLADYRRAKRTERVNWTLLDRRETLAIFLPSDAAPQEVRDCLHEELAQALGPLNDLYRLPDSVFNDDNVHTVLTGFDMLILRATYAPELRSGMTRAQVAARLPAILARLNPAGEGRAPQPASPTPRAWVEAVQEALGPGATLAERREAANRALRIAMSLGWEDHRRGFCHYVIGRLTQGGDPERAHLEFARADRFFARSPETRLHRAYVATQLAAYSIRRGHGAEALNILAPNIEAAARHENAALLSTLLMLRAEALDLTGRASEGGAVRLDSLGWARYGFGPEWAVRAKVREIEALNPLKG